MIQVLLFDFSRVLLHPKDSNYLGQLNDLNRSYAGENPLGAYPFWNYFFLNTELLTFIKKLKKEKQIRIVMFTTDIIQQRTEIQEEITGIFDTIFTARELQKEGVTADSLEGVKATKEAYFYISQKLSCDTSEIFFVDDTLKNIEAAKQAGCSTFHFLSQKPLAEVNRELIKKITAVVNS